MRIKSLELANFRNLQPQLVHFPSRIAIVKGRNGQGKTSLLEGIYLLAHTRSFRAGTNRDFVRWKPNATAVDIQALVSAQVEGVDGEKSFGFELTNGRRKVFVNGKPIESARQFYGHIRVVEFSPDDLDLVKGSPAGRRTLLDKILTQIDSSYVDNLVHYQRALKQRNQLLQSNAPHSQCQVWDRVLVQNGRELVARRVVLLKKILPLIEASYREIATLDGAPGESLTVSYTSQFIKGDEVLGVETLLEEYRNKFESDRRYQSTKFGPHRDELKFDLITEHVSRDARLTASQGQARSIALSLKLSSVRAIAEAVAEPPVLLLDDFESELDSRRRESMVRIISEIPSQVIITTTDSSSIGESFGSECSHLEIVAGKVL